MKKNHQSRQEDELAQGKIERHQMERQHEEERKLRQQERKLLEQQQEKRKKTKAKGATGTGEASEINREVEKEKVIL